MQFLFAKREPYKTKPLVKYVELRFDMEKYCISLRQGWVIRLLAPDAVKIDLKKLGKQVNEDSFARTLLKTMGWETANIHLGSKEGPKLLNRLENLQSMEKAWLQNAAERMRDVVKDDFKAWRKRQPTTKS
jgi:Uncharacterized protein conserved in bacteria (DUF2252)